MEQNIITEANRLKNLAGQELDALLTLKFNELKEQGIIKQFWGKTNFNHTGFTYKYQYKTNYILKTLDDKLIIINSSNSFRDRVKQDLYDFQGIMQHADISNDIIASILLYPDEEFERNSGLVNFKSNVINKVAYCPASHILSFTGLIHFLENHKITVEQEREREEEEANSLIKDGSYYGLRGNAFEKEVVDLLNCYEQLNLFKSSSSETDTLYRCVLGQLTSDYTIGLHELISVKATNTVKKLASGGNAKADVIIEIQTVRGVLMETISIKNTTQNRVSCHDYRAEDFIRVLNIAGQKLADYFLYYQELGSHKDFVEGLPPGYSAEDFEALLIPHHQTFIEWALKGEHDHQNLIDPGKQVSNYLLINKSGQIKFTKFDFYIDEIYKNCNHVYGVPLSWTYPSKKRGQRIQLKLPIII
ncbi:MspI family type II restriction endonuclease [Pseudoalteromonas aliena]|uniref:Restriction endonuclease n=1 Tax=Pseudoalteromonas aliena SW19 TaxID=1314866 RepID=A0ABR9E489_9GAMM|nr:MspI family type II restriction endonuclease [Pseudoalteromonas aliena]MBE0360656.1 hypothetical protein [Pseudoalteromonas aliena SW19]